MICRFWENENFTTISDAVAAAPNKTSSTAGYFLIYVTAGVYEENVSIDKKKTYLMMVGDGINKTIITGNRSVVDGWTTFKSATFGTYYYYSIISIKSGVLLVELVHLFTKKSYKNKLKRRKIIDESQYMNN